MATAPIELSAEGKQRTHDDVLEAAVRDHARLVFRIAYSVLRNHHDAEDATQETFVRVLRYGNKLSSVEDQRNWLARVAWRVAVDRRKRTRKLDCDLGTQAERFRSSVVRADEVLLGSEMMDILERTIAKLPEKLRSPLILSTIEEMSPADIASVLEVTESAVRSRLFRARQMLKGKLATMLGGNHGG